MSAKTHEIAREVHWLRLSGVNVYLMRSVTGHGIPLAGPRVAPALRDFAGLVRSQESP